MKTIQDKTTASAASETAQDKRQPENAAKNVQTYRARFIGREIGAIGKFYRIETDVEARNSEEANLALYDRFEHISALELNVLGHDKPQAQSGKPENAAVVWSDAHCNDFGQGKPQAQSGWDTNKSPFREHTQAQSGEPELPQRKTWLPKPPTLQEHISDLLDAATRFENRAKRAEAHAENLAAALSWMLSRPESGETYAEAEAILADYDKSKGGV